MVIHLELNNTYESGKDINLSLLTIFIFPTNIYKTHPHTKCSEADSVYSGCLFWSEAHLSRPSAMGLLWSLLLHTAPKARGNGILTLVFDVSRGDPHAPQPHSPGGIPREESPACLEY